MWSILHKLKVDDCLRVYWSTLLCVPVMDSWNGIGRLPVKGKGEIITEWATSQGTYHATPLVNTGLTSMDSAVCRIRKERALRTVVFYIITTTTYLSCLLRSPHLYHTRPEERVGLSTFAHTLLANTGPQSQIRTFLRVLLWEGGSIYSTKFRPQNWSQTPSSYRNLHHWPFRSQEWG